MNKNKKAKSRLLNACRQMDADDSGYLTLDELQAGVDTQPVFANALQALNVKKEDLNVLFKTMDTDASGSISYAEFVENLHKMKTHDTEMMLVFIQHCTNSCHSKIAHMMNKEMVTIKQELGLLMTMANDSWLLPSHAGAATTWKPSNSTHEFLVAEEHDAASGLSQLAPANGSSATSLTSRNTSSYQRSSSPSNKKVDFVQDPMFCCMEKKSRGDQALPSREMLSRDSGHISTEMRPGCS